MFTEKTFEEEEEFDKSFVEGKKDNSEGVKPQKQEYYYLLGYNDERNKEQIKMLLILIRGGKV